MPLHQKSGNWPAAKKSLGQNFLQDRNIARKIVGALDIAPGDQVLEIGPGSGALSGIIQGQCPSRLVLVEKDRYWARERMREGRARAASPERSGIPLQNDAVVVRNIHGGADERPAGRGHAFAVVLADALRMPWEHFTTPWKFIGNLPYNIASPLMWDIFSRAPGLVRAVFMIQKEVGRRITANPGTSAYGALSVWVQSHMRVKTECIVPPQVFRPRPKVDSVVLVFDPVGKAPGTDGGQAAFVPAALARTLKLCFQMRRKQLGTILRVYGADAGILEPLGIDPEIRPENLAPEAFHRLSGMLFPPGNAGSPPEGFAAVHHEKKKLS